MQEAAVAAIAELQGPDPDREAIVVNVYQVNICLHTHTHIYEWTEYTTDG